MEPVKLEINSECLKELVVGNKRFRSPMDFRLEDSDIAICRTELKESEAVRDASIRNLREMLINDGEIKYRTDDDYLLRYLRYKKFNVKETYKKLRKFYKTRMECPNLFYLPTSMDRLLNSDFAYLMPYTDEKGMLIFIIRLAKWKVDEMDFSELMNLFNIVSDVFCLNPRCQITGFTDIFDLTDESLTHIAHYLQPRNVKLWTKIMQELYPWRINRLLFYNMNPIFYAIISSGRLLVKKKVADRVIPLRSDLKELHKYVSPNVLPKEYGGNLEKSEYRPYLKRCLIDNIRYLEYEHSFIGKKSGMQ